MKRVTLYKTLIISLALNFCNIPECAHAQGSGSPPTYAMQFTIWDAGGAAHDTSLTGIGFMVYPVSRGASAYFKWKNQPFAVIKSDSVHIGLYADSATTFVAGQTVGWAFTKVNTRGRFDLDYARSNIWPFFANSTSPNLQVAQTSQGIQLQATTTIGPNTALTVRYQDIIALFPGDPSVHLRVR